MRPLTLKTINKHLMAHGYPEELVKGRGYFYFVGPGTDRWYTASVMVNRLNQLTLDQWVAELNALRSRNSQHCDPVVDGHHRFAAYLLTTENPDA